MQHLLRSKDPLDGCSDDASVTTQMSTTGLFLRVYRCTHAMNVPPFLRLTPSSRLFPKFPDDELGRLKQEAGLSVSPEQVMSSILDAVPSRVAPERALLFFPAPYNAGCNGTHQWMAKAMTFAGEKQASCGPAERTTVVRSLAFLNGSAFGQKGEG